MYMLLIAALESQRQENLVSMGPSHSYTVKPNGKGKKKKKRIEMIKKK